MTQTNYTLNVDGCRRVGHISQTHLTEMDNVLLSYIDCAKKAYKMNEDMEKKIMTQNDPCAITAKVHRQADRDTYLRLCNIVESVSLNLKFLHK